MHLKKHVYDIMWPSMNPISFCIANDMVKTAQSQIEASACFWIAFKFEEVYCGEPPVALCDYEDEKKYDDLKAAERRVLGRLEYLVPYNNSMRILFNCMCPDENQQVWLKCLVYSELFLLFDAAEWMRRISLGMDVLIHLALYCMPDDYKGILPIRIENHSRSKRMLSGECTRQLTKKKKNQRV